jgi:hypothetical protein
MGTIKKILRSYMNKINDQSIQGEGKDYILWKDLEMDSFDYYYYIFLLFISANYVIHLIGYRKTLFYL